MSVIIRLQNLPWSANAADIRKYFHGLSIPEGGVHIVGGEQGDAFIAFSTDEDARQAMLIDGGKINEVKIKLLLSSRSEMQKVIETARQQAMNLQTYMQMPAQPPVMPSMASLQNIQLMHQMAQHVMPMGLHPVQVPQVPLPNQFNPLSAMKMPTNNIMTNNLTQNQMQNQLSPSSTPQPQEVVTDVDKIKSDSEDESKKGSHRSRESSHSRSRSRSKEKRDRKDYRHRDRRDRDKDHGRDRDRYRERDRDRDRDKERERDRERDRDRDRDRRRRSNSRDKHRSRRHRSRSRERSRRSESLRDTDRHHDRDRDKERDRRRSNSKEVNGDSKASDQETIKQPDTVLINGTPAVTSGDESPSAVARPMNPVLGFPRTSGMAQPPLPGSNQFPPMPEPPRMPSWPFPGHMMSSPILDDQKQVPWGAPQPGPGTLPPPPMFMPPDFLVNSGSFPPNMKEEKPRKHIEKQNEENHSSESNTPKNSCVQIQNLSARANYADIERFFHGLQIVESGIKMINNDDGNRSGIAYVRFANDNLKNQALKLSGRSLRETKVKVVHLDDYVYNEAIDNFQPARPKDNKPLFDTLKLLQLPRYIKEKDIMSLFTNVRPRKVIIYPNENLCDAFVEFENPQEAAQAISQPLMLGRHQVAVEPVFEKDPSLKLSSVGTNMFLMDQKPEPEIPGARTDPRRKSIPEKELPNNSRPPHLSEPLLETPVISTDCLLLKGLPFKANDRDILDFFSDVGIVPSKIHIMFDKQRKPAGDAFCEFNSIDEANRGLVKQNAPLDRNLVSVVPVPRHEMLRALGIVAPIPPMAPMPGHGIPGPGPIPGMMMPPMGIRMPPAMHPRPVRPDMFPGPPKFPPAPRMDPDFNHDSINVDGFGKPGCVITLENVPFSAGVEDILHFFKGFELMRQNIIRRFDDNGKPTGDARVCLKTPAEAQEAVQKLNKKTIRHRIIYLSALD